MNYKDFSPEFYSSLQKIIEDVKQHQAHPCVAFDADGTLWNTDLGENFFKYQIKNKLVRLPENPWQHYLDLKKINNNPRNAYLWLAQINEGQTLEQVRKWAEEAIFQNFELPIFEAQKKIIKIFHDNNIDVFVVTASIKWAVEPGANILGIPNDHVIGVQTKVVDHKISNIQEGPITYRSGKVDGLLHFNGNRVPFFCSGNTTGDYELLKAATHSQLAVSGCRETHSHLYQTEVELQKLAHEHGWNSHIF